MPGGPEVAELSSFSLVKAVLSLIPVQAGLVFLSIGRSFRRGCGQAQDVHLHCSGQEEPYILENQNGRAVP
jgi:hypothetical protein